jgi:hypothetical protein
MVHAINQYKFDKNAIYAKFAVYICNKFIIIILIT